jgi:hypothetical protein
MATDLDTPTPGSDTRTADPSPAPSPPRRTSSAGSFVAWAIVGGLVVASIAFLVAVLAGSGDGADEPTPGPVTVDDVSGSDRHLENLAGELEAEARSRHLDATAAAMAQQARERGIPTPTESGAPVPVAPDGSDRHLENLADELEAGTAAPTEAGADDGTASSGDDREDAQRVEIMADKDGSLEP